VQERTSLNITKAKILERIASDELRDTTFKMFCAVRGKNIKSGLNRLKVPSSWPTQNDPTDDEWADSKTWDKDKKPFREVTLPDELEYYLVQRNRRHFGQAEGTCFTVPPLSASLNWQADTNTAELLLQGHYDADSLDDVTQLLLRHCKHTSTLDAIPTPIALDEFIGKLKVWSESTSTSPSGRHLGHYKSLIKPIVLEDKESTPAYDSEELNLDRVTLLHAHLGIINYCLRHGYSLNRWKDIINVMILKEPGNTKVHRLRVIHIFEADYNLILSLKWRSLLKHAEDRNLLNDGQCGSCTGREAPALPYLEELKTEIAYGSRKPLLNMDNVQYTGFQEAQRAQATGCDCGLNLLVQSLLIFI
jgi:hypothetical protein